MPLHPWPIYSPALRKKIAAFLAEEMELPVKHSSRTNYQLPTNN
jgi:hypothetical protein